MYGVKLDIDARNLLVRYTGDNRIKLEVKTPSQKTFGLEVMTDIEHQSTSTAVRTDISFKTLEDKQYRFTGGMNFIRLGGPYNFKIQSQHILRLPEGQNTALDVEFQHLNGQQERIVEYKVSG